MSKLNILSTQEVNRTKYVDLKPAYNDLAKHVKAMEDNKSNANGLSIFDDYENVVLKEESNIKHQILTFETSQRNKKLKLENDKLELEVKLEEIKLAQKELDNTNSDYEKKELLESFEELKETYSKAEYAYLNRMKVLKLEHDTEKKELQLKIQESLNLISEQNDKLAEINEAITQGRIKLDLIGEHEVLLESIEEQKAKLNTHLRDVKDDIDFKIKEMEDSFKYLKKQNQLDIQYEDINTANKIADKHGFTVISTQELQVLSTFKDNTDKIISDSKKEIFDNAYNDALKDIADKTSKEISELKQTVTALNSEITNRDIQLDAKNEMIVHLKDESERLNTIIKQAQDKDTNVIVQSQPAKR